MFKIENPFYLKIWDGNKQAYITYFYNIQDFIIFISSHFYWRWDVDYKGNKIITNIKNSFIEHCACSPKDKGSKYLQVFDNYNKIINPKNYLDKAYEYRKQKGGFDYPNWHIYDDWAKNIEWKRRYNLKYKNHKNICTMKKKQLDGLRFRIDPIPETGNHYKYKWFYRTPRTKRIKAIFANPEMKEFNRSSVKMIPQWWDDCPRGYQRSWKRQSKAKHQWQKASIK